MYETLARFAQTWGFVYIFALFAGAVAYALWPSNRARFDRAARAPLAEDRPLTGSVAPEEIRS